MYVEEQHAHVSCAVFPEDKWRNALPQTGLERRYIPCSLVIPNLDANRLTAQGQSSLFTVRGSQKQDKNMYK